MNSARDQHDIQFAAEKIYKDALAFRLLRFHGFDVTPGMTSKMFKFYLKFSSIQNLLTNMFGCMLALVSNFKNSCGIDLIGS